MPPSLAEIKARLIDRYTAAELAAWIELDTEAFLDYFLSEVVECAEILETVGVEESQEFKEFYEDV